MALRANTGSPGCAEPTILQTGSCRQPETRSRYPFAFRLEVTYAVIGADLAVTCESTNTGDEILPASIGAHPAFNWPLLPEVAKENTCLTFSDDETAPIRRLKDGLMRAEPEPTPIRGKTLALSERLFDDDAVILDGSRANRSAMRPSRAVDRNVLGGISRTRHLVEPRRRAVPLPRTLARLSPVPSEFDGEFVDKPGLMQIAPGGTAKLGYRMRVGEGWGVEGRFLFADALRAPRAGIVLASASSGCNGYG